MKKCLFDKFYTKKEVVAKVISVINFNDYDFIVEPSAGNGSFTSFIPSEKSISLDLVPESDDIIEMNWFDYNIPEKYKKVLVIGNPPFGNRNKLSRDFIKHALSFNNVYTVAFILPNVFKKHTNQKIIPKNMVISHIIDLPKDSFLHNGLDYHVPCSFFVFTKNSNFKDLRFDVDKYMQHKDFKVVKRDECPDFYVMGAALNTVKEIKDVHPNNRGYYIKSNINIDELKRRFKDGNWLKYANSSVNGGVSWFSKPEMFFAYSKMYGD